MIRLYVDDTGTGPAVLLLHGTPSPASHLRVLRDRLARSMRVLVPDMPGYGRSPALPTSSVTAIRALIEQELVARRVDSVAVVGYSGGGYQALALAVSGAVQVTSVVTLGGYATLPPDARDGFRGFATLLREQPAAVYEPQMREVFVGNMLSPAFRAAHPARAAEVAGWLHVCPPSVLSDELGAVATCPDLTPELARVEAPILAVVGDADAAVPPARSEEICRAAPRTTLEVVADAGHALLLEAPDRTIDAVLRGVSAR